MFLTILLFPLLWAQESRESCGRLSYNHTFPIALGIQFQEVEHLSHHLSAEAPFLGGAALSAGDEV